MALARVLGRFMPTPPSSIFETSEPRGPFPALQPVHHLIFLLGHWPLGLVPFVGFAYVAIIKRNEEKSWICALMVGVMVFGLLQEVILHI
jgi:hypothetical protein